MTAEVAVMNKSAVALAADSAATSPHKIYNSVNKLFRLSDHFPVGIMIYGNAEIMGVPWESIIKVYRQSLGTDSKKTLKEYATAFISYLVSQHGLFPDSEREMYVQRVVSGYLQHLRRSAKKLNARRPKNFDALLCACITSEHIAPLCSGFPDVPHFPADFRDTIKATYGAKIDVLINQVFKEYSITNQTKDAITNYCIEGVAREFFDDYSGVVIAGFGEDEMFPSLIEYQIEGMAVSDNLKFKLHQESSTGFNNSAGIIAFAQKEMVQSFMTGIHPYVKEHSEAYLDKVLRQYEELIIKSIGRIRKPKRDKLKRIFRKASETILGDLDKAVSAHQMEYHISPVVEAVGLLPKDELAAMAESLVNLTVLKRRVSTDKETVGGPIDVAVISKGDGFIWIKRKHYFTKDLNPRYITQYFPVSQFNNISLTP